MPNLNLQRLERLIGKEIVLLNRIQLEDQRGRELLRAASRSEVAFLVPGDPMVATTHITLLLSLSKMGIHSRLIHGSSVSSAICGATGLQSYKFGKTVTVPYDPPIPPSVIETISENNRRGLHALLLLDVNVNTRTQVTVSEALARIGSASPDGEARLAIGVARLGALDEFVRASRIRDLVKIDFGNPPHSIVIPGKLHFVEAEALKVLCGANDRDLSENQ